jgi:hypothetical protein
VELLEVGQRVDVAPADRTEEVFCLVFELGEVGADG